MRVVLWMFYELKGISAGCFDEDGHCATKRHRDPAVMPFNRGGSAIVDNWELGNIKQFLESAEPCFHEAPEWYRQSIGLYIQSKGSKHVLVKCALLNILLDRISTRVSGSTFGNEIDPKLNERLERKWFRCLLHRLLRTLSKKWERTRTDSLCDNVIKRWNAEPSFPQKVLRACAQLGIPKLSGKNIGFRHKLLHVGEFNKKLKSLKQKAEYAFDIDAVIGLMIIRLLKFDGFLYLQTASPHHKRVSDFLTAKED